MPLSQALEILQLHSGAVQTALLTYSDQKPFEQDLSIDLNQDGVRLNFDPRSQRLKVCITISLPILTEIFHNLIVMCSHKTFICSYAAD